MLVLWRAPQPAQYMRYVRLVRSTETHVITMPPHTRMGGLPVRRAEAEVEGRGRLYTSWRSLSPAMSTTKWQRRVVVATESDEAEFRALWSRLRPGTRFAASGRFDQHGRRVAPDLLSRWCGLLTGECRCTNVRPFRVSPHCHMTEGGAASRPPSRTATTHAWGDRLGAHGSRLVSGEAVVMLSQRRPPQRGGGRSSGVQGTARPTGRYAVPFRVQLAALVRRKVRLMFRNPAGLGLPLVVPVVQGLPLAWPRGGLLRRSRSLRSVSALCRASKSSDHHIAEHGVWAKQAS